MLLTWKKTRNTAILIMALCTTLPLASAQVLSKAELKKLVATANTPQDHERIAKHFDAKAAQYETDAKDHEELASEYAKSGDTHAQKHPNSGLTAEHCRHFAAQARRAAEEARRLAADHRTMAKPAK